MLTRSLTDLYVAVREPFITKSPSEAEKHFTPEEIHGFLLLFLGVTKLMNAKCSLFFIQRADLSKEVIESHLELIRTLCVYQEGNIKASKKAFLEYFLDEWESNYAKLTLD